METGMGRMERGVVRPGGARLAPRALLVLGLAFIWAGCAGGRGPEQPAPQPPGEATAAERGRGIAPNQPLPGLGPLPVPDDFRRGLEAGTRTEDGRPGPRYWQQRVRYRIDAELDPRTAVLQGEEEVVYHNSSPDTLHAMIFHLHQNLFSEGVERTRRVPITGGMKIERVAVGGEDAAAVTVGRGPATGAAYQIDGALLDLRLPSALAPGDSVVVRIGWSFTVPPRGAPRTGHIDHSVYNVAQWYPQVAVYDDLRGWNRQPYLGNGEFYQEYADFEVSLTLPEGWLVGATGELQNPEEVLPAGVRRRLRLALERDTVVHVVGEEGLGAGNATERAPGGQLTWRFSARNVRDFAWGTSDQYLWDATRAVVPDPENPRATKVVPVHALYRARARTWREAANYTRHALTFHAERWGPYYYPQITALEGPVGGMEYPMVIFVGGFRDAQGLYGTINHEVAHQWFPMMVGSNETRFAWQDEGLGSYIEELATADFFPDYRPFALPRSYYLQIAGTDYETPMMRPADLYPSYPSFAIAAYFKPALLLRALGGVIGEDKLHEALRVYTRNWLFKKPHANDFFNTVESVAGQDLDWFWTPWWYGTGVFDQGIAGVTTEQASGGEAVTITVEDRGDVPMPSRIAITHSDGQVQRTTIPVERWLEGARSLSVRVTVPGRVTRVELDPEELFPDRNRNDNVWVPGAAPAGSGSR